MCSVSADVIAQSCCREQILLIVIEWLGRQTVLVLTVMVQPHQSYTHKESGIQCGSLPMSACCASAWRPHHPLCNKHSLVTARLAVYVLAAFQH